VNVNSTRRDAELTRTRTIAAANANNVSTGIDTGPLNPHASLGMVEIEVAIPAIAANSDATKNLTVQVRDSADNSTFAAVAAIPTITIVGVASTGSAATTRRFKVPADLIRRYVGVYTAVDNGGPTLTGSSVTLSILT
jgi:hypothetical protein